VRFTSVVIILHLWLILLVDRILPLELFPTVGICILLLESQLFDGRFWRSSSPAELADLGAGGKHHGCADVRALRILFTIVLRLVERELRVSPDVAGPARQLSSPPAHSSLSLETERTR